MSLASIYQKGRKKLDEFFTPTANVRVRDVVREAPKSVATMYNAARKGNLGRTVSNNLDQIEYFRPQANKVRVRDFVREIPRGIDETAQSMVRDTARAGLSLYEIAGRKKPGRYYNTPLGRINSIHSETHNRLNRGDSTTKAIAHGVLDTALAIPGMTAVKPMLRSSKNLKILPKEARFIASDLTQPMTQQVTRNASKLRLTAPSGSTRHKIVNGKLVSEPIMNKLAKPEVMRFKVRQTVPTPFQSKALQSIQSPGLTIKNINAPKETLRLNPGQFTAKTKAEAKRLFNKYGKSPDVNINLRDGRKLYATQDGSVSSSRKALETAEEMKTQSGQFKDTAAPTTGFRDVYRNFERFFGNKAPEMSDKYLKPFEDAKGVMFKNLDNHAKELKANIVDLGIKPKSKESAAVQQFGEGKKDYATLVDEFGKETADKIVKADSWFRAKYDQLLDEVNEAQRYIYPNNPNKQIPRRNDYYRHFREMKEGFAGLMNLFETPAGIDNTLAGVSGKTKPNQKWLSFAQKRLGGKTDEDAVGGFLDYIRSAEYAKNVNPQIKNFRNLRESLALSGNEKGADYNNFLNFIDKFADDLAGKTNPLDRGAQDLVGRKPMAVLDWLNKRVKANTVLGNASSAVSQIFAVPHGIASAGEKNYVKGLNRLAKSIGSDDAVMRQSPFLQERYFKTLDQFDTGLLKYPKKFAGWMITVLDELGTKANWNAHYEKAIAQGIQDPIRYADDMARKMIGGRGIGEVPIAQKSKIFQMVAPFQLEVTNQWYVLKELSDESKVKLLKGLAYTYLFNRVAENVRGSDVAFDPINALMEGFESAQEEDTIGGKSTAIGGRMAGEVLSNLPLGQTVASAYPEFGFKVGEKQFPTREKLFGEGDPTRYGSGLLAVKGLQDPLFKVAPPFGGTQIKRTLEGIDATNKGYSETKSGRVRFPTEDSLLRNTQRAVFGQYSTPNAREFFDEERQPLGDVQSEVFKQTDGSNYDAVMKDREAEKEKKALKEGKKTDTETFGKTAEAQDNQTSESIVSMSNGKFYSKETEKVYDSVETAEFANAKQKFKESDKNFEEYGDKVFRKKSDGSVSVQDKTTYDTQVLTKKMTTAKKSDDLDKWLTLAEDQIGIYEKQLEDPSIDELERITIQDKIDTLLANAEKYQGYGGFKKGSSGKPKSLTKAELEKIQTIENLDDKYDDLGTKKPVIRITRDAPLSSGRSRVIKVRNKKAEPAKIAFRIKKRV